MAKYTLLEDEPAAPVVTQPANGKYQIVDENMGMLEQFGRAAGHHLGNAAHGAAQLVENAIGAGSGAASRALNSPDNFINNYIQKQVAQDNAAMRQRESEYQSSVPDSAASYSGAAVGGALPFVVGGGANALRGVGDMATKALAFAPKLAQKVGAGAAQGAAIGATSPVLGNEYLSEKLNQLGTGAVFGGALPIAGKALGAVGNAVGSVRDLIDPSRIVGRNSATAIGDALSAIKSQAPEVAAVKPSFKLNTDGTMTPIQGDIGNLTSRITNSGASMEDVIAALRNPKNFVPGSRPTTAQSLADVLGSKNVGMVQIEKALANKPDFKTLMSERGVENTGARLAQLAQVAKSPDDIAAAIAARKEAVAPQIQSLLTNGAPVASDPIIVHIDKISQSSLGVDPVIKKSLNYLRDSLQKEAGDSGVIRPDILDAYRQNLRNIIADNSSNGAVSSKAEAGLNPLKNTITDSIEQHNPGYRAYLADYAKFSTPINTMEAGQNMLGGLQGALDAGGNSFLALTKYNSLLAKALKGEYGIDPSAEKALRAVQSDLQRETISNSIKSGGSDTAYNLGADTWLNRQIMGGGLEGQQGHLPAAIAALAGGATGGPMGAAAAAGGMKGASKIASNRLVNAWSDAMMNPEVMAENLARLQSKQAPGISSKLAEALKNMPIVNQMGGK
jgi:hypothetical protein